jgi:S1-C subfamily serine protease/regulation of enolase protein 1 (concanavalin A-like superfamily)
LRISTRCSNPECARQGVLPDSFPGGRVRCPACGTISMIAGAATPAPVSQPMSVPRVPTPAPKKANVPLDALGLDDDEAVSALVAPVAFARGRSEPAVRSGSPLKVVIGVVAAGSALAILIAVLMVVFRTDPARIPDGTQTAAAGQPHAGVDPSRALGESASPVEVRANAEGNGPPTVQASPSTPSATYSSTESPAATVQRLKQATVYVKVQIGKIAGTGTGFVISAQGDQVVVATNRHVVLVRDEDDDGPTAQNKTPERPKVSVVFRSGEPGLEQELPAELVAVDLTPDHGHDLAILLIRGVRNVPRPIDPLQRVDPVEGMEGRIYGFPFGEMLNVTSKGNPAITVNKGAVSSLRRNEAGGLALIQIDGSVNPGNSGGPIVDEKGRLIGITVAKLRVAENIGLAIPGAELVRMLDGRVGGARLALKSVQADSVDLDVEAFLSDPLRKLHTVGMSVAPASSAANGAARPAEDGSYPPLQGATQIPLTMDRTKNVATGHIRAPLTNDRRLMVQFTHQDNRGRTYVSQPTRYDVPAAPGPLMALGANSNLDTRLRKTMSRLGPLIDPDKDCASTRDGKLITITLPPNKLHMLGPQFRDKKSQPVKNAPMLLSAVDGDFIIHAKVAGDILPGTDPCPHPNRGKMPFSVQGAGVLLWQDKENYLRLERSCGGAAGKLTLVHRLILEICKDGRVSDGGYIYLDVPEGALYVMLVRQKGHLRCLFSNNGRKWTAFKELAVVFPEKAQVGLSAFNTSKLGYTAKFEEFVLIDDPEKIAKELEE